MATQNTDQTSLGGRECSCWSDDGAPSSARSGYVSTADDSSGFGWSAAAGSGIPALDIHDDDPRT